MLIDATPSAPVSGEILEVGDQSRVGRRKIRSREPYAIIEEGDRVVSRPLREKLRKLAGPIGRFDDEGKWIGPGYGLRFRCRSRRVCILLCFGSQVSDVGVGISWTEFLWPVLNEVEEGRGGGAHRSRVKV